LPTTPPGGTAALFPAQPAPNRLLRPLADALARAPADWAPLVRAWQATAEGLRLQQHLAQRQAEGACIYPAEPLRALAMTPRRTVRVVLLGQDPYHGAGQAEGLAFSVPAGVRPPPSLRNILDEISRSLGVPHPPNGHLGGWARQGVLLLNTALTVEDGQPAAHAGHGWEALTDALIEATAADAGARVYLLWGAFAQAKAALIEAAGGGRHLVLRANHPSPLSARRPPLPFIGCGHFTQVRDFLAAQGTPAIDWSA
jgi:uracil-DNA glycosylase